MMRGFLRLPDEPAGLPVRIEVTEKNAQGQTIAKRQYVYDGLDLLAELDGSGNLVAAYTHGPGIDDPLIVRYDGVNHIPCS